jgi:ketosteroid isomerase-like protein
MKKRIHFLLAMLLASVSTSAQEAMPSAALEDEIRALDLAHARAIFESDAKALDVLMDDEVTVNHPTGRIVKEKKELLDLIRQGVIRYTAFERTPERFLFFPGMVVVMGGEVVVPAPGAPNAGQRLQRRYTNAWMKRDGKWRLAFRHANNVCPPRPVPGQT